jgi:hypothetical protein
MASTIFITQNDPRNQLKTNRAGIVPYTIAKDGTVHLCFGRDAQSKDLCDFGGGIKYNEHTINGAFREFSEETCGIFSNEVTLKKLFNESITLKNKNNTILFIRVSNMWMKYAAIEFRNTRAKLVASLQHQLELLKLRSSISSEDQEKIFNLQMTISHIAEICDIVWVPLLKFFDLVTFSCEDDTMWVRIAKFFQKTLRRNIDTFDKILSEVSIPNATLRE